MKLSRSGESIPRLPPSLPPGPPARRGRYRSGPGAVGLGM